MNDIQIWQHAYMDDNIHNKKQPHVASCRTRIASTWVRKRPCAHCIAQDQMLTDQLPMAIEQLAVLVVVAGLVQQLLQVVVVVPALVLVLDALVDPMLQVQHWAEAKMQCSEGVDGLVELVVEVQVLHQVAMELANVPLAHQVLAMVEVLCSVVEVLEVHHLAMVEELHVPLLLQGLANQVEVLALALHLAMVELQALVLWEFALHVLHLHLQCSVMQLFPSASAILAAGRTFPS